MKTPWKTYTGQLVEDLAAWVRENTGSGQSVHIGTDSIQTGRYTQFVTVLVVLNPPKGGRVVYQREAVPKLASLRERLFRETWTSVRLGMDLTGIVPGELSLHLDVNPEARYKSSKYVEELVGLVVGQGFRAVIKPESWAASHAADHICRHKGKMPKLFGRREIA